jgi:predicted nucleic-acid-binding Zn-ribbon protein
MKPCPECGSDNIYRYKKPVDAEGAYGPNLLPKLASGWFSTAKILPVICAECGYTRFFASKETRHNPETSEHWEKV